MIIQCTDCKTRYQLDPERVPRESIRVRCPKCRYVFALDGRELERPAARVVESPRAEASAGGYREIELRTGPVAPPPPEPTVAPPPPAQPAMAAPPTPPAPPAPAREMPAAARVEPEEDSSLDLEIERSAGGPMRSPAPAVQSASAPTAVATAPPAVEVEEHSAPTPQLSPEQDKSRRLARALVSDILVYNRELRDKALADGKLVQALGQEIKKSWELYKEKVTPEVASSTNHFREALNDILADGQKIF